MAVGGRREPTGRVDRVQIAARQSVLSASGIAISRCPTACFVTRDAHLPRVTNTRPQFQGNSAAALLAATVSFPLPHLPSIRSCSHIMASTNLSSAMDVDEQAIDEGLYSRQL